MSNGIFKDIIESHIKKENELEKKIEELKEELNKAKESSENSDYFLYKDILNLIIPHLKFEYEYDEDTSLGGYNISTKYPIKEEEYSISLDHVKLPLNLINELLKEVEIYKQKYNI